MKKIILIAFFSLQIIEVIAQKGAPILTYKAAYSSSYEMTNNKYSAVIMNIWKEFGNNNFSNFPGYFADTVQLQKLTGEYKGSRDNFIGILSANRGRYKAFDTKIDVIFSLRSTDKKSDWVSVYGYEYTEDNNGKRDTTNLHELWKFNEKGKVSFISQYARKSH